MADSKRCRGEFPCGWPECWRCSSDVCGSAECMARIEDSDDQYPPEFYKASLVCQQMYNLLIYGTHKEDGS